MATEDKDTWTTIDVKGSTKDIEIEIEDEDSKEVKQLADKDTVVKEIVLDTKEQKVNGKAVSDEKNETEAKGSVSSHKQEKIDGTDEETAELRGIETNGAKKRIRQLIKQRKERDEEIERLRSKVQELSSININKDKELVSSVKDRITATEAQLNSGLEKARSIYKNALEQNDTDKIVASQEEISKYHAELVALREKKEAFEATTGKKQDAVQTTAQKQTAQPRPDPKAVQWAQKHSDWFAKDQLMTEVALGIDVELKAEGYNPDDDEYYEEIETRLKSKFPKYKFNTSGSTSEESTEDDHEEIKDNRSQSSKSSKAVQVVSGGSRSGRTGSSTKTNPRRVKLTQEDVRLASKFGISLEKYAAQKLAVEQAGDGYTEINV